MSQEITTSTFNLSEIYMGPMVMEYEQPSIDMGIFIDTPLELNIMKKSSYPKEIKPYEVSTVYFDDSFIILKDTLLSEMTINDGIWFIKNQYLNINVWGESLDEVFEAFNFTFCSIYKNFVMEDDDNLSRQGIELKNKMKDLILFCNES